jgi:hypothetical protein
VKTVRRIQQTVSITIRRLQQQTSRVLNLVSEKEGVNDPDLKLGLTFILRQSFARWIIKLLKKYEEWSHASSSATSTFAQDETYSNENIEILDARKISDHQSLSFPVGRYGRFSMSQFGKELAEPISNQDVPR